MGILDSGASSHFLLTDAHCTNIMTATESIKVQLLNGTQVKSSYTTELDTPQLPVKARKAHIVPGLATHSLVSVVKLCNAGCRVLTTDTDISCIVKIPSLPPINCRERTKTGLLLDASYNI